MNIKKSALKGLGWMGGLRGATRVIAYIKLAFLARILNPFQFGLYGIVTLVITLLETLTETGVNVFFIQDEGEINEYVSSSFIVSILRGAVISLLLFVFSKPIGNFFNSPEVISMIQLSSLVPLLRGFINPAVIRFHKELEFGKEFVYRFVNFSIIAGVSVWVSYITGSAVGMVWGLIAGVGYELLVSHLFISPRPQFILEIEKVKKVINRGKWVTASGVFDYAFKNIDDALVGRWLGTDQLGIYQAAYKISSLPITEIADVFGRVTFPIYAKIRHEKKKLQETFRNTLLLVTFLTVPMGVILYLIPELVIKVVLGDQWLMAVPILRLLAVFGVVRAIGVSFYSLFLALKKQEYVSILTLASTAVLLALLPILIPLYGVNGAAISAIAGSLFALPVAFYLYQRLVKSIK